MIQDRKPTHLSLFSGIGGLDLAAEWAGFRTVGQCEWAEYPTKVLEKHWPDVARWKDIRTLTGENFYERTGLRTVDVISGGFPCQPFSVAGKQRGKEDDRYLWPEMVRVIKELGPTWVVGENVAGIIKMALPDILSELEACGYRTRTFLIPACAVGARHRRYRVAIVGYNVDHTDSRESGSADVPKSGKKEVTQSGADSTSKEWLMDVQHTNSTGCKKQHDARESDQKGFPCGGYNAGNVCHTTGKGLPSRTSQPMGGYGAPEQESERSNSHVSDTDNGSGIVRRNRELSAVEETGVGREDYRRGAQKYGTGEWRATEPLLGGVADGFSNRLDEDLDFIINHYWDEEPDIPRIAQSIKNRVGRLKALGNAVVPQQFYPIFKAIYDAMGE